MPDMGTPMLAISSDTVPEGDDWVYEVKWDGVRAYCRIERGRSNLVSRKGTNIDPQYPELSILHQQISAHEAILDGEVTVLDDKGRPSFSNIQPRIMASDASQVAQFARTRPAVYFAFDLLWLDGRDLRGEPLRERKRLLASIIKPCPVLKYSEHFDSGGKQLLELARAQELEGIVAKRASSFYSNTRSSDWVKVKIHLEQEFVIVGFTEGARDYFGALVLAHYDNGKLTWAGNVGTGFDQKLMKLIHEKLVALRTDKPPIPQNPELPKAMTWVKPELICSVRFHQWTPERRLRAPVFIGLRTDVELQRPVLIEGNKDEAAVTVDDQKLRFKNLNKVFYPAEGYTKRDVLNYYDAVSRFLIPHWKDRPLSLRRYPDGIGVEGFFQKRADIGGMPDWVRTTTIVDDEATREMVVGDSRAELIYLTNLGCIDQNPWMSRVGSLDKPDFILIDLDPFECPYDRIVEAAQLVRKKLDALGLTGYPKTTGGNGMHIYIPVEPVYTYDLTKGFAEILSRLCTAERPDLFTMPRKVSSREKGRVYFDFLQNGHGKTISAPYVLRAKPGAPVATPLEWREVSKGLIPGRFNITNAIQRFERVGDLFAGVLEKPQRLEPAMERLEGLLKG
jgi:bifunctional non-homologous end joining protein LigD